MPTLRDKFRGCFLGGAIGDVAGAVVEAESPAFISKTYQSVDDILSAGRIEEFAGGLWEVGRFTDDTQMTLCVAEWLLNDNVHPPAAECLLARFAATCEPWRRYGPGTEAILRLYREHPDEWRTLATAMFPHGSYGNGSAMRVAPVGLAFFDDPARLKSIAIESSRPTHSHPLAYQGAVLQSIAVATAAVTMQFSAASFLEPMRQALTYFADLLQDTSKYAAALDAIERSLKSGSSCGEVSSILGTGITAYEAVPMALYCFLRHPDSYEQVIQNAVFIGGDTDTIGSMAGAIAGVCLGEQAIPPRWLNAVREERYSVAHIRALADRLFARFGG
jgi:poly(ADP-ribose) glycohydrolase ARH3